MSIVTMPERRCAPSPQEPRLAGGAGQRISSRIVGQRTVRMVRGSSMARRPADVAVKSSMIESVRSGTNGRGPGCSDVGVGTCSLDDDCTRGAKERRSGRRRSTSDRSRKAWTGSSSMAAANSQQCTCAMTYRPWDPSACALIAPGRPVLPIHSRCEEFPWAWA